MMITRLFPPLLVLAAGLALSGGVSRRPAPEEGIPVPSAARPIRLDTLAGAVPPREGTARTVVRHGKEDDQPAGACWLASLGGAPPSCVCSAGTIETLLTPDYMRALLAAWRDGGSLSASELHARLWEVNAACSPQEGAL